MVVMMGWIGQVPQDLKYQVGKMKAISSEMRAIMWSCSKMLGLFSSRGPFHLALPIEVGTVGPSYNAITTGATKTLG